MKLRTGFVSNSSSSSFVLELTPENNKIEVVTTIDLEDQADEKISTVNELKAFYEDIYGHWADCDYDSLEHMLDTEGGLDDYLKMKESIEKGNVLAIIDIDNNETTLIEAVAEADNCLMQRY